MKKNYEKTCISCFNRMIVNKTRQDKTRQDKTRQDKTRQDIHFLKLKRENLLEI